LTFYSSKKGTDSTWCTNTEVQKLQGWEHIYLFT
jgi:hypothetical protein